MRVRSVLSITAAAVLSTSASSFAAANLSLTKTGPATIVAGTDIVYQITVTNDGPDTATRIQVLDTYSVPPDGETPGAAASCSNGIDDNTDAFDLVDQDDPACDGLVYLGSTADCSVGASTATEGTLNCNLSDLLPGASSVFTVKFHVTPTYHVNKSLFVTNSATVEASEFDTDEVDNTAEVETSVEEVADLRITKIVEPSGSILAGQIAWYTVWVDNYGPSAARNVTIRDTLLNSGDVSVQSCAFSVSQGGGSISQFTCLTGDLVQTQFGTDIGTFKTDVLYPHTSKSEGRLRGAFRIKATTDIDVTNTARVGSDTPDPNPENNYADVPLEFVPVVDLRTTGSFAAEIQVNGQPGLSVPSSPIPPMPQAPNYTFGGPGVTFVTAGRRVQLVGSAINQGPSPASNVTIEYLLPFGATLIAGSVDRDPFNSGIGSSCITDPDGEPRRRLICVYDQLAVDEIASVKFQILVDPSVPAGTELSVDNVVSSDEFDPALVSNVSSIQFVARNDADLQIDKSLIGSPVAGTDVTYRLDITNHGPSVAHDVTLRDALPEGVTLKNVVVDYEGDAPAVPLPCGVLSGDNTLVCSVGDLPPTATAPTVVFINVHLDADLPGGTVLTNTADVLVADTPDPVLADNSDSVDSEVTTLADVSILKTSDFDIYSPSSRVTYTLTITNNGPSTARDLEVIDTLPPAKGAVYLFDSGGCLLSGGTLTCPVGDLADGASTSFNVYMLIKGNKGRVTNTASVSSSTDDLDLDNNTSFKTVLIKGGTGGKGGHVGK